MQKMPPGTGGRLWGWYGRTEKKYQSPGEDNVLVSNINAPIKVTDICRDGIGFVTTSVLPIGFYFNSRLEFKNSNNAINCVVQIIRQSKSEDGLYHYGCTFIGMPAVFDYIFEEIEEEYKKAEAKAKGTAAE